MLNSIQRWLHFKLIWINYAHAPLTTEDKETVYEALLKNFKDNGQTESFKRLDIEYNNFKWEQQNLKFLSNISKWWWNYGYDKELIFKRSFLFILVFSLITFFLLNYLNLNVYSLKNIPELPNLEEDFISRSSSFTKAIKKIFIRMWYSFVYVSTLFFRLTLKVEDMKFDKFWGALYIMLIYTIGLICLAYMANFVLQK